MKTKNKAHDAASYSFRADERILVDANVWLKLLTANRKLLQACP